MSNRKLWGEMEEEEEYDEAIMQNVNFKPIIELGMQNIPEIPITVMSSPIDLPKPNLITHAIQMHAYSRQLSAILEQTENAIYEGARLDVMSIPNAPPEPILKTEPDITLPETKEEMTPETTQESKPPIHFLEKTYGDFSLGKGPVIMPFTPESHKRALRQCAAIAFGHVGIATCTNTALTAVTDALDFYMTKMCKMLRLVVDQEAGGLKSGFPDAISKVLTDLNVGNLHEFHDSRIVRYHSKIKRYCEELRSQCEALAIGNIAPQLKLEEVPEIHFPAALDGAFTPSLEPGFQMLQSLEQEQLQGLELLETVNTDDIKVEPMELSQSETARLSPPMAKKKRK